VCSTDRGREVYAIAGEVAAELESEWTARVGRARMPALREILTDLNQGL